MSSIRLKSLLFGLTIGALTPVSSFCLEHWDDYSQATVPWSQAHAIVAYNNELFVSGNNLPNTDLLWKTTDGKSWQTVAFPSHIIFSTRSIQSFREHNGFLYAFNIEFSTVGGTITGYRYAYRSTEGLNWNRIDNGTFSGQGTFSDAISFNGYLYVGDRNGKIWRTNGQGTTPVWSLWRNLGSINQSAISFSIFQNYLYIAVADYDPIFPQTRFYQFDGNYTTPVNAPGSGETLRAGTVNTGTEIYWAGNYLEMLTGAPGYENWTPIVAGVLPTPFMLNGQLHAVGPSSQVLVQNPDLTWSNTDPTLFPNCATNLTKYGHPAVLNQVTYLLPCNLIGIRNGLYSIQPNRFSPITILPGQSGVLSLQWTTEVNFNDTINLLNVVNLGTAEAGKDIESVALYKTNSSGQNTMVTALSPGSDLKSWALPPSVTVPVIDGETYSILVNIAPNPTNGSTIQLSLPTSGISVSVNSNYILPAPLMASQSQGINVPASAPLLPIEMMEIYPNPARDLVRFLYTLPEQSDVKIRIYDRAGRLIEEISENSKAANDRALTVWDARHIAPGVYYSQIRISGSQGERSHKSKFVIER